MPRANMDSFPLIKTISVSNKNRNKISLGDNYVIQLFIYLSAGKILKPSNSINPNKPKIPNKPKKKTIIQ